MPLIHAALCVAAAGDAVAGVAVPSSTPPVHLAVCLFSPTYPQCPQQKREGPVTSQSQPTVRRPVTHPTVPAQFVAPGDPLRMAHSARGHGGIEDSLEAWEEPCSSTSLPKLHGHGYQTGRVGWDSNHHHENKDSHLGALPLGSKLPQLGRERPSPARRGNPLLESDDASRSSDRHQKVMQALEDLGIDLAGDIDFKECKMLLQELDLQPTDAEVELILMHANQQAAAVNTVGPKLRKAVEGPLDLSDIELEDVEVCRGS